MKIVTRQDLEDMIVQYNDAVTRSFEAQAARDAAMKAYQDARDAVKVAIAIREELHENVKACQEAYNLARFGDLDRKELSSE